MILCKPQTFRHVLFNSGFQLNIYYTAIAYAILDSTLAMCRVSLCWLFHFVINLMGLAVFLLVAYGYVIMVHNSKDRPSWSGLTWALLIGIFGKLGALPILVWRFEVSHMFWMDIFVAMTSVIAMSEYTNMSIMKT